MFKFFKTIRSVKKLKEIEPDQGWLKSLRLNFISENPAPVKPAFYKLKFAASIVAMVIILGLGGGIIQSAQAALPNDNLYPIKMWVEKIQSWTTLGNENKMALALKFAEKRFGEFEKLEKAQGLSDEKREEIMAKITAQTEKHLEKTEAHLQKWSQWEQDHPEKFQELKERFMERKNLLLEKKEIIAERFAERKQLMIEKFAACAADSSENPDCPKFKKEMATSSPKINPGAEKIIGLLGNGAGKSGEAPKGLFRAFGIKKKLHGLFEFPSPTTDEDENDENEGDGGNEN